MLFKKTNTLIKLYLNELTLELIWIEFGKYVIFF